MYVAWLNLQRLFWPHGLGHAVEIRCCSEANLTEEVFTEDFITPQIIIICLYMLINI